MALVEPTKKGGRYTIKEQEERKIRVYHLHFNENKSAVKISELLGVSRNTINADTTYWYSQLANEVNTQDPTAEKIKQIQRIEIRRDRCLELLEGAGTDQKFKIEKFISDIDNRLLQYYSKMEKSGRGEFRPTVSPKQIDESELKELIRGIVFSDHLKETYSENDLKFQIIHKTKSDMKYVQHLFEKMKLCGLGLCMKKVVDVEVDGDLTTTTEYQEYDVEKFAKLREYVTSNEMSIVLNKRSIISTGSKKLKEMEEELITYHGPISQWPEITRKHFEKQKLKYSHFFK